MSDFTSVFPKVQGLDPNKRVNYVHGLVLGVDELLQEELYLLEKDRSHNRFLHGFGTVCGLKVSVEAGDAGPQVKVDPGVAVNPAGQQIRVPRGQCAFLNEWLNSHGEAVAQELGSPAEGPLSLYLMLCYRECKTDHVPIPTGPCQSLEESTAPSRIADDFSLSLELQPPPDYHFESPIRALSELLLSVTVEAGGTMTLEELKALVRGLKPEESSPPLPPPAPGKAIAPENVQEFFNAAFLVWVTEVKPHLVSENTEIIPSDPSRNCVFLARIDFEVESSESIITVNESVDVIIDEQQRPYLVSTQGMQNYLGPVSFWLKTLSAGAMPAMPAAPADDSALVHLAGTETITGQKTFAAALALSGNGRVEKVISLPAHQAHHGRGTARGLFSNMLPSMHYMTTGTYAFSGEALFALPVPDDIDFSEPLTFRLVWGFQGLPEPSDIEFKWTVGARFFAPDQSIPASPFHTIDITVKEKTERRNDVLVTEFHKFDSDLEIDDEHRYGAMRVSVNDPGVETPQIYLLSVDLRYIANRLGGGVS